MPPGLYTCETAPNSVWHKAIQPKKWWENFPATKIALLFIGLM